MIAFIDDQREVYGVEPICGMLRIAPSTYHARVARRTDPARASPRARHDLVLMAQIRQVHAANFGVYGARKVWRQLAREGIVVARCTVERLMRRMGLRGAVRGKETREPLAKLWRRSARFVASGGSASAIWRCCSDIAWYSAASERFWVTSGQPMATLPRNGGKALMACLGANALR